MPKQINQFAEVTDRQANDLLLIQRGTNYNSVKASNFVAGLASGASFSLNYTNQILIDTPDIFYRFLETSGTTASDSSGFSRNGTYQSEVSLNQSGILTNVTDPSIGTATNGCSYPNPYFGSTYTALAPGFAIEAWFQLSASGSDGFIFYWGQNNGSSIFQGFGLYAKSTEIRLDVAGVVLATYTASVGTNVNHLVANVTKSAGSNNLAIDTYLNGQLIGSRGSGTVNLPTTNAGLIGKAAYGSPLLGKIAQFAFYGAPLAANRINSHYKQGIKA